MITFNYKDGKLITWHVGVLNHTTRKVSIFSTYTYTDIHKIINFQNNYKNDGYSYWYESKELI